MLHHLVNLQAQPKVCAIATECNFVGCVKMANQLQSRAIQTKTRSDNSGQVRVEGVEVLVSRVPGELADSDEQAARQLHWPAAHTRIPSTPSLISAARLSIPHAKVWSCLHRNG